MAGCALFEPPVGDLPETIAVPNLTMDDHVGPGADEEPPYIVASLVDEVPATFTGCIDDTDECYVLGEAVDVEVRYEPQSGRYWFLDPGSGNTYFTDGELRTGDAFLARRRTLAGEAEGELVISGADDGDAPLEPVVTEDILDDEDDSHEGDLDDGAETSEEPVEEEAESAEELGEGEAEEDEDDA